MRRFFLILLVLLLPLQSAWAAATAYCQHEQRPAAKWHLGHHQHEHRGEGDGAADADKKADNKAGADQGTEPNGLFDPDCGTCHLASLPFACPEPAVLPALRLPRTVLATHDFHYTSLHPRAPDRPQWLRLA